LILAENADDPRVANFAKRVIDISVYLDCIGIDTPPAVAPTRIAYHDACHLAHAQKVRKPPRLLLQQIPGVTLVPLQDSDLCCGSAGTYNIDQPEIAATLGARKATNIIESQCDVVALGNIGCQIQIEQHLAKLTKPIPVLHTVQILDRAYRGLPLA
jgi:glycolate oxidase iron-sulfur subunit